MKISIADATWVLTFTSMMPQADLTRCVEKGRVDKLLVVEIFS